MGAAAVMPLAQVLAYLQLEALPTPNQEFFHSSGQMRLLSGKTVIPINDDQQVVVTAITNKSSDIYPDLEIAVGRNHEKEGEYLLIRLHGNMSGDNVQFRSAWIGDSDVADTENGCEELLKKIQTAIKTKTPITIENMQFKVHL